MSKIFITGTSGIGKTTLGKHLAEKLKIPFINGSSKVLWEKYKIESHAELLKMVMNEPAKGLAFQYELLDHRKKETKDLSDFITDRSPIDNAVYFLLQNSPFVTEEDTKAYLFECKQYFKGDYRIIYLSHDTEDRIIEDDNMRITNSFYQNDVVGPIMDNYINHNFRNHGRADVLYVKRWNWYERILQIDEYLRPDIKVLADRQYQQTNVNAGEARY